MTPSPPYRFSATGRGATLRGAFRYFAMRQFFQGMQICKGL